MKGVKGNGISNKRDRNDYRQRYFFRQKHKKGKKRNQGNEPPVVNGTGSSPPILSAIIRLRHSKMEVVKPPEQGVVKQRTIRGCFTDSGRAYKIQYPSGHIGHCPGTELCSLPPTHSS